MQVDAMDGGVPPEAANICHLEVRRGRGTPSSTGTLIGGRYLVTAAHNVARLRLTRGLVGTCGSPQSFKFTIDGGRHLREHVPGGYIYKAYDRDYTVIDIVAAGATMEGTPPPEVVHLPRAPIAVQEGEPALLLGYPGNGYQPSPYDDMFGARGEVVRTGNPLFIRYAIDTATGNSGGPVIVNRDGLSYIVGVHITESRCSSNSESELCGVARFFDEGVLRHLRSVVHD
ncbi:MAG: trypsin-like peptidase domain-containing protein [Myxococcales bacterium]|nr:trypsin-like peptidase domain-containing protein [Myxococcales bacterium]